MQEKFETQAIQESGAILKYGKTAALYFDMTDPDIQEDFRNVIDAQKMSGAIWDIGLKLRNLYKHGFDGDKDSLIEVLRDHYYQVLSDHEISRLGY